MDGTQARWMVFIIRRKCASNLDDDWGYPHDYGNPHIYDVILHIIIIISISIIMMMPSLQINSICTSEHRGVGTTRDTARTRASW